MRITNETIEIIDEALNYVPHDDELVASLTVLLERFEAEKKIQDKRVADIENVIKSEYRKHKRSGLRWERIAALKLYDMMHTKHIKISKTPPTLDIGNINRNDIVSKVELK